MMPLHPHNAPLQLWLELGAIGAAIGALAIALAIMGLIRPFRAWHELGLATGAVVAIIAVGAVGYGAWQGWWLSAIWLLAAALAALAPPGATEGLAEKSP